MKILAAISLFIALSRTINLSSAIEARPIPFTEIQPDGEKVVLLLQGDEFDHGLTDIDGKEAFFDVHCNDQNTRF
jgi:hypothetical protein